jgi:hypothetical protein
MAYRDPARQREAERRWYRANRQKVYEKKDLKRARLRAMIRELKSVPCADCGGCFPYYVMDFDHVDGEKLDIVSSLVHRGSVRRLVAEIAKCEVVCANCHRIRTWNRMDLGVPAVPQRSPTVADGPAQLSLFVDEPCVDRSLS